MTDPTAAPADEESMLAECGCPPSAARQNRHSHVCLIQQTVAVHRSYIPADPGGRTVSLSELAAENPAWGSERVLPDGAILLLRHPTPPAPGFGLWQRQGSDLVMISEAEYARRVPTCGGIPACGLCKSCAESRDSADEQLAQVGRIDATIAHVIKSLDEALGQDALAEVEAPAEAGTDGELDSVVNSARRVRYSILAAKYALMAAAGSTSQHLETLRRADPDEQR